MSMSRSAAVITTNALYLAADATATARVRMADEADTDEVVRQIDLALESLDRARTALRGW